jgi:subtilisin family serine protease
MFSRTRFLIVLIIGIMLTLSLQGVLEAEPQAAREVIDSAESTEPESIAPWWERWSRDSDRNGYDDRLDAVVNSEGGFHSNKKVDLLIDYDRLPGPAELSALHQLDLEVTYKSRYINTMAARNVPLNLLPIISGLEGVVMIEKQSLYRPSLDVSVPAMKVRPSSQYTNVAYDFDVDGDDIVIAIIDTGVDDDHDGLTGKFIAGADFSGGIISFVNPDDKEGHGTHVAGIAMGTGGSTAVNVGVAPGASLVDVKVFNDWTPTTSSDNVMRGIEWCIDNVDTYGIDVMSLSIGEIIVGNDDGSGSEAQLLDSAVDAGMVVVVSAGNEGPNNNGFSSLAASEKAITVAAVDDKGTVDRSDDGIADFSSRGPRADDGDSDRLDEFKPDIAVPGVDIDSAMYAASFLVLPGNGYTEQSGTSMAAPHIAGLAALLLEANPTLSPDEVKNLMRETADSKGSPYDSSVSTKYNKDYGWGIVDGYEAVRRAMGDFQRAEVTSFAPGDTVGGIVEIKGTASNDKGGIEKVELSFNNGGSWQEAEGTYSWSYDWDSTTVGNGQFNILVRTYNGTDHSDVFRVTVSVLNVLADFSFPYEGMTVRSKIRIEGTLSTNDAVHFVEVKIDEGSWSAARDRSGQGTFATWYYELDTNTLSNGEHTIYARTFTNDIYSKETPVNVIIDNPTDSDFPVYLIIGVIIGIIIVIITAVIIRRREQMYY